MFTRDNTKEIKAIAIIYMLMHHLYRFPEKVPFGMNLATGAKISEMEFTMLLGTIGQACVAMFMFLGGYGLYKALEKEPCGVVTSRIISLYQNYWKVFFIVVPIGFLFFAKQEQYCETAEQCFRFSVFSGKDFIASALGLSCTYNSEWWFFKVYLFAILTGAIFISLFKKCDNVYIEIFAVIIIQISAALFFPSIRDTFDVDMWNPNLWLTNMFCMNEATPLFFMGTVFAKYDILEQWKRLMDKLKKCGIIVVSMIGMLLCAYSRAFIVHGGFDLVLIPVYIFLCGC